MSKEIIEERYVEAVSRHEAGRAEDRMIDAEVERHRLYHVSPCCYAGVETRPGPWGYSDAPADPVEYCSKCGRRVRDIYVMSGGEIGEVRDDVEVVDPPVSFGLIENIADGHEEDGYD